MGLRCSLWMLVPMTSQTENYGTVFCLWRTAAGTGWTDYVAHDFVRQLQDGSLKRANFMHYLIQDYIFLMHFSRAWALAVTKSETIGEMQLCAATVNALICDEIKLHIGICAEAGIDQATLSNASEATANLAYTRYVLDAGHSGDMVDLLATLAPCVMGYGEIGLRLCQSDHAADYADWINTYGGTDYQDVCIAVGQLIDTACHRRLGEDPAASPRWPLLQQRFDMATRLETGFWQMGLDG